MSRCATEEYVDVNGGNDLVTEYTVATVPDADTVTPNTIIFVSDAPAGMEWAISDGLNWRIVAGGAIDSFVVSPIPSLGLRRWYSAKQQAPADLTVLGALDDFGGDEIDLTAAGSARPTYRTGILDGIGTFRFDGALNKASAALDLSGTNKITIGCVFILRSSPLEVALLNFGTGSLGAGGGFALWPNGPMIETMNNSTASWFQWAMAVAVPHFILFEINRDLPNNEFSVVRKDGVDQLPIAYQNNGNNLVNFINDVLDVGGGEGTFCNLDLMELMIWDRLLDVSELDEAEQYAIDNYPSIF